MWGWHSKKTNNFYDDMGQEGRVVEIDGLEVDNQEDSTLEKGKIVRKAPVKTMTHTHEEIVSLLNSLFGSSQNVYQYCGPGTYYIVGPTNTGKTFCIRSMLCLAQIFSSQYELNDLRFTCLVLLSSTNDVSDDFSWAGSNLVCAKQSEQSLARVISLRQKEMEKYSKIAGMTQKEWAASHPMMVVVDDFAGSLQAHSDRSSLVQLVLVARHYGIYLNVLAQTLKLVGPSIRKNVRAIIGFALERSAIEEILKEFYCERNNDREIAKLHRHMELRHHPAIFALNWVLNDEDYGYINRHILCTVPFPAEINHEIQWISLSENNSMLVEKDVSSNNNVISRTVASIFELKKEDNESLPDQPRKKRKMKKYVNKDEITDDTSFEIY